MVMEILGYLGHPDDVPSRCDKTRGLSRRDSGVRGLGQVATGELGCNRGQGVPLAGRD